MSTFELFAGFEVLCALDGRAVLEGFDEVVPVPSVLGVFRRGWICSELTAANRAL